MKEGTMEKAWPYYDIVDLPHHVSDRHQPMELYKRAAQFAPFAALTGYDDAIAETARLTEDRITPDDNVLEEMNRLLAEAVEKKQQVIITYFVPDEKKSGGRYVEAAGLVRKLEMEEIVMEDGARIPLDAVGAIGIDDEDGKERQ